MVADSTTSGYKDVAEDSNSANGNQACTQVEVLVVLLVALASDRVAVVATLKN